MRQRTRLVQRHLRMVLILVDGRATVGELGEKVGNAQLVEGALADLEKDGFVVPLLEQPSVWDKGSAVVQKVKEVALEQFSSFGTSHAAPFPESTARETAPLPTPEIEAAPLPEIPKAPPTVAWLAGWTAKEEKGKPAAPPQKKPVGEDSGIRPIRRDGRPPLGLYQKILLGCVGLLALAAGIVALYPYDRHRAEVEALLTRVFQQPVKASRLAVVFFPRPGLLLEEVRVGENEGVVFSRVRFVPELGNLHALKEVELSGGRIPLPALVALPGWQQGARAAGLQLGAVYLRNAGLQAGPLFIPDLAGKLTLEGGGSPLQLSLQNADHTLSLEFSQAPGGLQVVLDGQGWEPLKGSAWRFDSLNARGLLSAEGLRLANGEARSLEGQIKGSLALVWGGDVRLDADLVLKHLSARRLVAALGQDARLEGEVDGTLRLFSRAPGWSGLGGQLQGDGNISVSRGMLPIDLAEAVRRASSEPLRGGESRFEQLNAKVRFDAHGAKLSDMQLSAGLLRASGWASVADNGGLGGTLEIQVGTRGNMVRMPLTLAGSVADPLLKGGRR